MSSITSSFNVAKIKKILEWFKNIFFIIIKIITVEIMEMIFNLTGKNKTV